MGEQRRYSKEYKIEAIKLSNKIGTKKAAEELGILLMLKKNWQ